MRRGKQLGITYIAVLLFIAIAAVAVAGQGAMWSIDRQRDKEQELLFVGDEFRQAIKSYYENTPGPVKRYPGSLEELTFDRRFIPARRHLRRVYQDPMTLSKNWGEMAAADGGIMGMYSRSAVRPLKQVGFSEVNADFAGKSGYRDWVFFYRGGQTRYLPPVMMPFPEAPSPTQ